MTHTMEQKVAMIDDYIKKLDGVIERKDVTAAKQLQKEIIGVYDTEIQKLKSELTSYLSCGPDYIFDSKILKSKLYNYKLNLAAGLYRPFQDGKNAFNITQAVSQEMQNSISITLDQTVEAINQIPDSALSADEKEILNGKLASLSALKGKDQKTRWDKAKEILKWIGDKGVEVGVAALPYIAAAIQK